MTPLLPYISIWVIMAVILTVKASPIILWPLVRSWDRTEKMTIEHLVAILITLVFLVFVFIVFLTWPLKLFHPADREHLYKYFR